MHTNSLRLFASPLLSPFALESTLGTAGSLLSTRAESTIDLFGLAGSVFQVVSRDPVLFVWFDGWVSLDFFIGNDGLGLFDPTLAFFGLRGEEGVVDCISSTEESGADDEPEEEEGRVEP